ncbi:tRNA glutamyl-Q(34) synthetase GluQRS [Mariniluteicoccus endophyticus]
MNAGRYAPSPTSDLHVGNLRTALLAWLFARSSGRDLLLRIEDLDEVRARAAEGTEERQIADLAALGLDFDGPVFRQSERLDLYADVAATLRDRVYECFCTRREIREATQAPHHTFAPYPGTCRDLGEAERARRRAERPAAWRVRSDDVPRTVHDVVHGDHTEAVDDFVIRRNDGAWAYNFVVVVDDVDTGVDQVVRGDDLLSSAPRQAWLTEQLGGVVPEYAHVPLVLDAGGERLAKRNGAVTMTELAASGMDAVAVRSRLAESLGLAEPGECPGLATLLERFDPNRVDRRPWVWTAAG